MDIIVVPNFILLLREKGESVLSISCNKEGVYSMKDFKNSVVYQIYPKSFNDSNNDGLGDYVES